MKCRKCGYEMLEDEKFCANCGAAAEPETPRNIPPEEPEQKRANPLRGLGVSVESSLEVGGLLGALLNRKKKKKNR